MLRLQNFRGDMIGSPSASSVFSGLDGGHGDRSDGSYGGDGGYGGYAGHGSDEGDGGDEGDGAKGGFGYPKRWQSRSTLSEAGRWMLSSGGSYGLGMSRSGTSSLSSLVGPVDMTDRPRISMTRSTRGRTVPAPLPKPKLLSDGSVRLDWQGEHYRHPRRANSTTGVLSLPEANKKLPADWIAVSSHRNNQTFFYNTRTRKAQWTKPFRELPPDPPSPPPPPPPVCDHAGCKGLSFCSLIGPKIPTDDDLEIRANEHDLVSMDFSLALMMHGPKILLAKVLLANVLHCFERWREGAKMIKHEREELHRRSATIIQANWRRYTVMISLFERYREYRRRLKCHDFPDIRAELKQLLTAMPPETAKWFADFKGSYMKQMVGKKKKTFVPEKCARDTCNQPGYLVQKNGLCRQCNFFDRFPEKASLGAVKNAMETPTKKRQEQQRLERIRQRKLCYYLRKDDLIEHGRALMGLKTGLTM